MIQTRPYKSLPTCAVLPICRRNILQGSSHQELPLQKASPLRPSQL
jgi:hypothetical protein